MTQSIENDLDELFKLIVPLSKGFNKKNYEGAFRQQYERFNPLFTEIAEVCEDAEGGEAAIDEIAGVLPGKMHALLAKESSKRKKENLLMQYNLGMVAFVIPLFRYGRLEVFEKIVDKMVVLWNDNEFPMDISKSTFEDIQSGFKPHFCYITTAVCQSLGKPDDCAELNLMRDYRDGYLAQQEDGADVIGEYYDIAPTIVKRIAKREDADAVYREIWQTYLYPCISLIQADRLEECRELYVDMVRSLREKYIYLCS
ncbi:MAG: hypothetical protein HFG41_01605 [Coprococcus sp.]|nr:hypothetical protein [Coprococcus sp.]